MMREASEGAAASGRYKRERRRFGYAAAGALFVHLGFISLLLFGAESANHGLPRGGLVGGSRQGMDGGSALNIALVVQASVVGEGRTANPATPPSAEGADAGRSVERSRASPAAETSLLEPTLSSTASRAGKQGSPTASRGDPKTQQGTDEVYRDVLEQIARCLPNDLRPRLADAELVFSSDEQGNLVQAPEVAHRNTLNREDTAAADRVVQAVLQCGPYLDGPERGRVVRLPMDFSLVR